MVRPRGVGKRGPLRKPDAEVSHKTRLNRQSIVRSMARRLGVEKMILSKPTTARTREKMKGRKRAPKNPGMDQVLSILLAKRKSKDNWYDFIQSNQGYGVYRNRVTQLHMDLINNVGGVRKTTKGAFLDPSTTIPMYLDLATKTKLFHQGDYRKSFCLFLDATEMQQYKPQKCNFLAVTLPQARRPHATQLVHGLGRWLGPDKGQDMWEVFKILDLVEVLRKVTKGEAGVEPMRLVVSPDWACGDEILGWVGPGHPEACFDCWLLRNDWKKPGRRGRRRLLKHFTNTPFRPLLELLESELDFVYDVSHCNALMLSHALFHALTLWARNMASDWPELEANLVALFKHHTRQGYRAPKSQKIAGPSKKKKKGEPSEPKEWRLSGNLAKDVLKDDDFWLDLCNLLPSTADGLVVAIEHTDAPHVLRNPLQRYVREVRRLCVQLASWHPEGVETRDADCAHLHFLYDACGLPVERLSVNVHYFLCHYTERLLRHGNLVGMSTEGGEHMHKVDKEWVGRRPGFPYGRCPIGLLVAIEASAVDLALWGEGVDVPPNDCMHDITLPPPTPQRHHHGCHPVACH